VRFTGRCYRGHDPMWSFTPLSGEGASKSGGRFNRRGEPTLYLALTIGGAVNEITQGLSRRLAPLTICEYDVDCAPLADLSTSDGQASHGVSLDDLACPWMTFLASNRQAPSWLVVDKLKLQGFAGMIAPSFAVGANVDDKNLILWDWGASLPTQVTVFDPSGRLPKDQSSWM
jgi:RES domain-containing protein